MGGAASLVVRADLLVEPRVSVPVPGFPDVFLESNVRGLFDIEREQVVRLVRMPVNPRLNGGAEYFPKLRIADVHGAPVELDVTTGVHPVAWDAMYDQSWIPQKIQRLLRLPHHAKEEMTGRYVDLTWTDARRCVLSNGSEKNELVGGEALLAKGRKLGTGSSELLPDHLEQDVSA